jgi:hypothetical protein
LALKRLPYKNLESLIGRHLSRKEYPETEEFARELSSARKRGYLKKKEMEEICKWKSPRAIWLIRKNTPLGIRTATRQAFAARNEKLKIELLTGLKGVSIPMASAILTFINPKRYGVIDIRVWQLLYKMKSVEKKASGVGFNFENWYQFHKIIRHYAKIYNVKARDIERTLFNVHVLYQKDNLYGK